VASSESRQTLRVKGAWQSICAHWQSGSLWVPVHQARARLILQMFEPEAVDSLLSWGQFNAHFETKEYMEDYVAEEQAELMLARDPALRAEFEAKLADPAFAKDPAARLRFFYQRHPAWSKLRVLSLKSHPNILAIIPSEQFDPCASPC
jgi:hypothetical protein